MRGFGVGRRSMDVRALLWVVALVVLGALLVPALAAASTFMVTTTNDAGAGSLRKALLQANASPGFDRIAFAIPGEGPHTIVLTSVPLPSVTDPVGIEGRTQPGFRGSPVIQIDNAMRHHPAAIGLNLAAGRSRVLGLSLTGFGIGIALEGAGRNTVAGNWIGLDPSGAVGGNGLGVLVRFNSSGNLIGGANAAARNVISGNRTGIELTDTGTANVVSGNFIGTGPNGDAAAGNVGIGLLLQAPGNTIGGATPFARNVISGNGVGVDLVGTGATGNVIEGNYVGTDATGSSPVPNLFGGLVLEAGASSNELGGKARAMGNVVSGNGRSGIVITDPGTNGNVVLGAYVGVDASGSHAVPNLGDGITVSSGATGTQLGYGFGDPAARNIVSGNTAAGSRSRATAHR